MQDLNAIRAFAAVVETGGFGAAARRLDMPIATISRKVKELEERLHAPLLTRTTRRVTLTEAGKRIAPQVSAAFDGLDAAFGAARAAHASVLTVSTPATFGPNWLAPRIGGFQAAHPDLSVRIHSSNALTDFARDEVDVAVRTGQGQWPGLASHFLMRTPVSALASPDYLARHPPIAGPDDILQRERISAEDDWWGVWCAGVGGIGPLAARGGVRMDSQLMEGRAAVGGHGFAVLNPMMWQAEIRAGLLVDPLGRHVIDRASFWLVYPEHRRGAAKIRAFRDWLLVEVKRAVPAELSDILTPP